MKKILTVFLIVVLTSMLITIPVSAEAFQSGEAKSVTATFPVIDGVMDDIWASANTYVLETAKAGTTDGGMRASFKLLWSPTTLYGIMVVPDTTPNPDAANNYQRDCVELGFDFSNSRETSYVNDDQFHWTVRTNGDGLELKSGIPGTDFMVEGDTFNWKMVENASGYTIEFSIACDKLGIALSADKMMAFEAQVNDNAEGIGERTVCYSWNDTEDASYNNPDHFGEIKLVSASVEPAAPAATPEPAAVEPAAPAATNAAAPVAATTSAAPKTADAVTFPILLVVLSVSVFAFTKKSRAAK